MSEHAVRQIILTAFNRRTPVALRSVQSRYGYRLAVKLKRLVKVACSVAVVYSLPPIIVIGISSAVKITWYQTGT